MRTMALEGQKRFPDDNGYTLSLALNYWLLRTMNPDAHICEIFLLFGPAYQVYLLFPTMITNKKSFIINWPLLIHWQQLCTQDSSGCCPGALCELRRLEHATGINHWGHFPLKWPAPDYHLTNVCHHLNIFSLPGTSSFNSNHPPQQVGVFASTIQACKLIWGQVGKDTSAAL